MIKYKDSISDQELEDNLTNIIADLYAKATMQGQGVSPRKVAKSVVEFLNSDDDNKPHWLFKDLINETRNEKCKTESMQKTVELTVGD